MSAHLLSIKPTRSSAMQFNAKKRLSLVVLGHLNKMFDSVKSFDSFRLTSRPPELLLLPSYDVSLPTRLPKRGSTFTRRVDLEVPGQGAISFEVEPVTEDPPSIVLRLVDENRASLCKIVIGNSEALLRGKRAASFRATVVKDFHFKLVAFEASSQFLWVSVDKANTVIKFGAGYMMEANTLIRFEPVDGCEEEAASVIRSVRSIQLEGGQLASQPKYCRLPIVIDPPPVILPTSELTLEHISRNCAIPPVCLPLEAQRLYGNIAGAKVKISRKDADAINYSLSTEGCALFEKLKEKALKAFGVKDVKTSYIRATIGANKGDSTGIPFVFEIWPKGHYSPVHNHGDTVAVIKVLHGSLVTIWYNPLAKESKKPPQQIKQLPLQKGDITWMTPELYQTHKLFNYRSDTMAATIQCYGYLGTDIDHHETFDYTTNVDNKLHYFVPKSDFTYEELLQIVRAEYAQRHKSFLSTPAIGSATFRRSCSSASEH